MPRAKHEGPARHHTGLLLSEENDRWLDEEKQSTGQSKSDLVNLAIERLRDETRIKQLVIEAIREEGIGRGA